MDDGATSTRVTTAEGAKTTTVVHSSHATAAAPSEVPSAETCVEEVRDKPAFPEDAVVDKYNTFEAPNHLLSSECVALVTASSLLEYKAPIDLRQNLPPGAAFHGPLELGEERHDWGHRMPTTVAIALSYTWAPHGPPFGGGKDHPDPEMFYLRIMQDTLSLMMECEEYKDKAKEQMVVFWVRRT